MLILLIFWVYMLGSLQYSLMELLTSQRWMFLDIKVKPDHALSLWAILCWCAFGFGHLIDL
jgi:hypothetical protein